MTTEDNFPGLENNTPVKEIPINRRGYLPVKGHTTLKDGTVVDLLKTSDGAIYTPTPRGTHKLGKVKMTKAEKKASKRSRRQANANLS